MKRPRLRDYLQPDERTIRREGRHPLSILDDVLYTLVGLTIVGVGLTFLIRANVRRPDAMIAFAWTLLAVLFVAYVVPRIFRVWTSEYLLTDQRIYESHGRLRFHLAQTTYDKITDLRVHQGFFGRILGFGSVRAHTAGAAIELAGVRRPFEMKTALEGARVRFIDALIADHRAARAATTSLATDAPAEAPLSAAAPLWKGQPTLASFLPNFIGIGVFALFALSSLGLLAFDVPTQFSFLPLLFLGFAGLSTLHIWVQYRYTRYEVNDVGLVVTSGWLSRNRVETTYEKITDVTTRQSLWGRLLGFGDILANTAGGIAAPIAFQGVQRPLEVKDLVERARARRTGGRRA